MLLITINMQKKQKLYNHTTSAFSWLYMRYKKLLHFGEQKLIRAWSRPVHAALRMLHEPVKYASRTALLCVKVIG